MRLNEKLTRLRKGRGLTQTELAEKLQLSRQSISRWEVGLSIPSVENLVELSKIYDIPLDVLLSDDVQDARTPDTSEIRSKKVQPKHYLIKRIAIVGLALVIVAAIVLGAIIHNSNQKEVVDFSNMGQGVAIDPEDIEEKDLT